ncbi:uncharacterized protein IWZ02DRAFT_166130 [Phyllosticta citriasiana]|uniref:uncharacterized protein n=1 Tax=Phyllosticta citriasiana TaxID=595635 RepID=UPI0030FD40B6
MDGLCARGIDGSSSRVQRVRSVDCRVLDLHYTSIHNHWLRIQHQHFITSSWGALTTYICCAQKAFYPPKPHRAQNRPIPPPNHSLTHSLTASRSVPSHAPFSLPPSSQLTPDKVYDLSHPSMSLTSTNPNPVTHLHHHLTQRPSTNTIPSHTRRQHKYLDSHLADALATTKALYLNHEGAPRASLKQALRSESSQMERLVSGLLACVSALRVPRERTGGPCHDLPACTAREPPGRVKKSCARSR